MDSLLNTISDSTIKLIIILDGCTDQTNKNVFEFLKTNNIKPEVKIIYTNDIWETKANNIGLKEVKTDYATILQDDMLIKQKKNTLRITKKKSSKQPTHTHTRSTKGKKRDRI